MPRRPAGPWNARRQCYEAALGEWYEDASGRARRRAVVLCYEDGSPVRKGDVAGHAEALARAIRAAGPGRRGRPAMPSTAALLQSWIDWHRDNGARPSASRSRVDLARTIVNVPWGGRRGVAAIGDVPADEFGVEHLFAVRAWLRGHRAATPGRIRNHDGAILAAFRWASQAVEGRQPTVILRANPFPGKSVRLTRGYVSGRPCPTWEELAAILDRLDARVEARRKGFGGPAREAARVNALWVRLIGERGCRPVEVAELRAEQWDDEKGGFVLGRHKMAAKTGEVGVIPLREATAARVRALIARPDRRGPWVFGPGRSEGQGPPGVQTIDEWWRSQRAHVGAAGYQLYGFRNTASNRLRLAGVEGREMQVAMRHRSEVADSTYRRDRLDEAAAVWARIDPE